jgi:hypothetical protein
MAGCRRAVCSQFTVGVRDNPYQAFKPYADGSNNTTVNIARVLPLTR